MLDYGWLVNKIKVFFAEILDLAGLDCYSRH